MNSSHREERREVGVGERGRPTCQSADECQVTSASSAAKKNENTQMPLCSSDHVMQDDIAKPLSWH